MSLEKACHPWPLRKDLVSHLYSGVHHLTDGWLLRFCYGAYIKCSCLSSKKSEMDVSKYDFNASIVLHFMNIL